MGGWVDKHLHQSSVHPNPKLCITLLNRYNKYHLVVQIQTLHSCFSVCLFL